MKSVLIIGAGISGLLAARRLQESGLETTVIDKGRGVGGRLATRRIATPDGREGKADHGAQYLTANKAEFSALIEELRDNNIVQEWRTTSGAESASPRYYAPKGMTDIAKYLAKDVKVRLAERVVRLELTQKGWTAHTDKDTDKDASIHADMLVITSPVPQTMMLLETLGSEILSNILLDAQRILLEGVEYTRSIVLMCALENAPRFAGQPLAPNGGIRLDSDCVWWITDNERKGISLGVPTLTIHATPSFSEDEWETKEEELIPVLLRDSSEVLGMQRVIATSFHRWRYSRVVRPFPEQFCALEGGLAAQFPCVLAGDAFAPTDWLPTRAEDAAVSGWAAADFLAGK
jgi:renalase